MKTGRLEVVVESGATYMKKLLENPENNGSVGGIIIDCTDFALDENSIASELFTPSFYQSIYDLLEEGCGFSQQITNIAFKEAFTERAKGGSF